MFLKKIEITGFKSFAKKTVLDFSSNGVLNGGENIGITTIVGPNGSGKSNIADALRWAMGEQSMKSIRGKKAEDIIFAGSDKKSRLGSAQVSIYLDNSAKKIPLDFDEVIITRKVFRNGESEYIINGSRVRLVDVVDLLAKAGVGQRSYCIINQGMADQVLNSTPVERRAIIEEAAGVKEFQVKKERSQRKLKSTENNLKQVGSLLAEIEPHLRMLKRQNNKAMKGEGYRVELKEKQHQLYGYLWNELKKNKNKAQEEKNSLGREMMKIQREVDELGEKIKSESNSTISLQDKISSGEEKLRQLNHKLNNLEREIIVEEGKLELEKERAKKIEEIEMVPVDTEVIKTRLSDIKSRQDELIRRINETTQTEQLQELKEYAQAVNQQLYELYEAVVRGQFEEKRPQEQLNEQKTVNLKKVHELMGALKVTKDKREKIKEELEKIGKEITVLINRDKEERKNVIELEDKIRRKQFDLDKTKDKFNDAKVELAKVEVKAEDLLGRIQNEMRIEPGRLIYKNEKVDVEDHETRIQKLKFQLEQIGGIDETVIEEYKETQKRFDFLGGESKDLEGAMKKLRKVIKEMDKQIKGRFEKTFKHINKEFNNYFSIIFNGGKAKLNKVEVKTMRRKNKSGDDGAEVSLPVSEVKLQGAGESDEENEKNDTESQVGIEIMAEPPGKKITSLNMLSGGERALTSIAMLFAIISHNPPPFALLDEVEAALDEANSKRFGKILKELSGQTQFVLITHNRQTMREAAVLYGVTMSDDGVSKLLSVKLDQVGEKGEIKE